MRTRPRSVFVPYELKALWHKVDDLPRFVEPHHVMDYLRRNPGLAPRRLDWREEFEKKFIDEYMNYVGEPVPEKRH